jgi:hypothetical protein
MIFGTQNVVPGWAQRLKPVISVPREAETRKIAVWGQENISELSF